MPDEDAVHERLIARIQELATRKKLSVNGLADFSGLSRGYISELLRGNKSPTVKSLVKIAQALDVEVIDLFR